jgi:hypothetical protein
MKEIAPEVESAILALSKANIKYCRIQEQLLEDNVKVSLGLISKVCNSVGKRRESIKKGVKIRPFKRIRTTRTPELIRKIKNAISTSNPRTQNEMVKRYNFLQSIIIHKDL